MPPASDDLRQRYIGQPLLLDDRETPADRNLAKVPRHRSGDNVSIVSHNYNRASLGLELRDPVETFVLKRVVANRQDLVDEQQFRSGMDGDSKTQAHLHSGTVGANGIVDKLSSSAKATIASNRLATSRRVRPLMTPLTNTFSRPVRSG